MHLLASHSIDAARSRANSLCLSAGGGFCSGDDGAADIERRLLIDKGTSAEKPEILRLEQRIFLKVMLPETFSYE